MKRVGDLRAQAESKRHLADLARRAGPGLSVEQDRIMMRRHAQELDAEAAGLEAQADALERSSSC